MAPQPPASTPAMQPISDTDPLSSCHHARLQAPPGELVEIIAGFEPLLEPGTSQRAGTGASPADRRPLSAPLMVRPRPAGTGRDARPVFQLRPVDRGARPARRRRAGKTC